MVLGWAVAEKRDWSEDGGSVHCSKAGRQREGKMLTALSSVLMEVGLEETKSVEAVDGNLATFIVGRDGISFSFQSYRGRRHPITHQAPATAYDVASPAALNWPNTQSCFSSVTSGCNTPLIPHHDSRQASHRPTLHAASVQGEDKDAATARGCASAVLNQGRWCHHRRATPEDKGLIEIYDRCLSTYLRYYAIGYLPVAKFALRIFFGHE